MYLTAAERHVWVHGPAATKFCVNFCGPLTTGGHRNHAWWTGPALCWPWENWPWPMLDTTTGEPVLTLMGKLYLPLPCSTLRRDLPWWHRHRTGSNPCMSGPALVAWSDQLSCHPGLQPKHWDGRLYHLSYLCPVGAWSCRIIPTGSLWVEAIAAYLRGEDPVMMVNCKQEALSQTNGSLQWRFAVRMIEQKVLLCDTNAT